MEYYYHMTPIKNFETIKNEQKLRADENNRVFFGKTIEDCFVLSTVRDTIVGYKRINTALYNKYKNNPYHKWILFVPRVGIVKIPCNILEKNLDHRRLKGRIEYIHNGDVLLNTPGVEYIELLLKDYAFYRWSKSRYKIEF